MLKRETAISLDRQKLNLQAYRDIIIAISRQYLRRSSQFKANTDDKEDNIDDEAGIDKDGVAAFIADLQATHSSSVAGTQYSRMLIENPNSTARHRELFREASQDWHHFLGFASTRTSQARQVAGAKRKNPWEDQATEAQIQRRYHIYECDIGEAFQYMIGSTEMVLRGNQGDVLQAIKHGQSPIMAIMPTGSGKSILFILPA